MKIAIIDYGAGNTKSVYYAFKRLGADVEITSDKVKIKEADGVVFPGVGHATQAMTVLKESKLDVLISELKQPVLGICLGMQLLAAYSEEGNQKGLGIIDSRVKRFETNLKVPQIGWNLLKTGTNRLFEGLNADSYVYFVHTYYLPKNEYSISLAEYGVEFSAAIQIENYYGCQFHPEKSGEIGERILLNFIKICESYQR